MLACFSCPIKQHNSPCEIKVASNKNIICKLNLTLKKVIHQKGLTTNYSHINLQFKFLNKNGNIHFNRKSEIYEDIKIGYKETNNPIYT